MTATQIKLPNPGSQQAIEAGCLCPILDNHYGKGWNKMPDTFVYNCDCPIHYKFLEKINKNNDN